MGRACGAYGEGVSCAHGSSVEIRGKEAIGRHRCRWKNNIRVDLQELGGGGDWRKLAQDRYRWRELVNMVMDLRIP